MPDNDYPTDLDLSNYRNVIGLMLEGEMSREDIVKVARQIVAELEGEL